MSDLSMIKLLNQQRFFKQRKKNGEGIKMIETKMKEKINLCFSFACIRMSTKWYHYVILNSKDLVMTHKDNMCLNFKLVKRCVT